MPDPTRDAGLPLDGLHALVTGGGSGIGLACARYLARDGATVTLMGRSADRLAAGAAAVEAEAAGSAGVRTRVGDVSLEADVEAAVVAAADESGGLDLAVASAGVGTLGPVIALPLETWQHTIDVNLTGAFLTLKHTGAAMARSGGGSFAAISSIAGPLTHRFMAPYCVSKAGLEMLVRNSADELGPLGIRVNCVRPSLVPTDLAAPLEDDPQVRDDYLGQIPLGRLGTVDDVAAGVRYLLGPESSWVTGQCIAIDGGHTLRRGPDVEHWARALYGDEVVDGR